MSSDRIASTGTGPTAREWDQGLHRSFRCAGRVCWVRLLPLWSPEGAPRWAVDWLPGPPARFPPEVVAEFNRLSSQAKAEILAHVASLQEPTT